MLSHSSQHFLKSNLHFSSVPSPTKSKICLIPAFRWAKFTFCHFPRRFLNEILSLILYRVILRANFAFSQRFWSKFYTFACLQRFLKQILPFSSLHDAYRVFHNSEIPRNRWKIILIVTSINFLMEKKICWVCTFLASQKNSSKKSFEIAKIIFHMFRLVSLIFTEQNSSDMTRDRCPICHTEKFSIFFVCCLTQFWKYERFWIPQWHFLMGSQWFLSQKVLRMCRKSFWVNFWGHWVLPAPVDDS